MKKLLVSSIIGVSLAFAFPGMAGGMMAGHAGLVGKPLKNLKDDTILAIVDGKKIRVKDINAYLILILQIKSFLSRSQFQKKILL